MATPKEFSVGNRQYKCYAAPAMEYWRLALLMRELSEPAKRDDGSEYIKIKSDNLLKFGEALTTTTFIVEIVGGEERPVNSASFVGMEQYQELEDFCMAFIDLFSKDANKQMEEISEKKTDSNNISVKEEKSKPKKPRATIKTY